MALTAYTAVYREHHPGLLRYAYSLTGDRWWAEDLVAEAHLRVWRRVAAGHRIDDPRAYLATTVRNLSTAPRETTAAREPGVDLSDPADGDQDWGDPAGRVAELDRLRELLGALPERWARALWLAEVEDMPLGEVGRRLGIHRNAAGVLLHRAREGLRLAYLRAHPGGPEDPACAGYWEVMPPDLRGALGGRRARQLAAHLPECADCRARLARLERINGRVAGLIGPAVLASGVGGGLTVAGAGGAVCGFGATVAVLGGTATLVLAGITVPVLVTGGGATSAVPALRPPSALAATAGPQGPTAAGGGPSAAAVASPSLPAGSRRSPAPAPPSPGPTHPAALPALPLRPAVPPAATAGAAPTPTPTPIPTPTPAPTATPDPWDVPPPTAEPGCRVHYVVTSQWSDGFMVQLAIENTGPDPVEGWTLSWALAPGQHLVGSWYGETAEWDGEAELADDGWNGWIEPGDSTHSGFEGSWRGTNPVPTVMWLNGVPCAVVPQ